MISDEYVQEIVEQLNIQPDERYSGIEVKKLIKSALVIDNGNTK